MSSTYIAFLWLLVFVAAAGILVRAAVSLAVEADEIADRTGMGRVFVGTLLLAGATSLPEVLTDVSAVLVEAPDLAVGDLFGSSMANMAILAVLDLVHRGRVWPSVELAHARVATMAIALTALAALGVLTPPGLRLGWVGADTFVVAAVYVAAVAWFRRSPVGVQLGALLPGTTALPGTVRGEGLVRALGKFSFATFIVVLTAPVVAIAGREIADHAGIAQTAVGVVLLAATTSLPELVASLTAARIGAYDLAVGNLFGSNAANMAILLIVDVAYVDQPLLAAVSPSQAVAATGAILLMAFAVAAIVAGTETRIGRFEPDAILVLAAYAGTLIAVAAAV